MIFSTSIEVSTKKILPKYNVTSTTDIKGSRHYIYSLKIYQKIREDMYIPLVIALWSSIENQDFFKKILIHLYEITQFIPPKSLIDRINQLNEPKYNIKDANNFTFNDNPYTQSKVESNYSSSTFYLNNNDSCCSNSNNLKYLKHSKTDNFYKKESNSNIMFLSKKYNANISSKVIEIVNNFKFLEIINLLTFLNKIIKPPHFTELKLNFHQFSVSMYFHSLYDLPNKDSCIQILLDCLELSTIIKLWTSLLCEKNVVILGTRSLLYASCSALLALIFPFKWLHTYIPVYPDSFDFELLEAPVPYLIGMPKERIDFKELCDTYPNHVICDLSTSRISKSVNYIDLPEQEETKLRTKVRYLRYPKLEKIEEMIEHYEDCGIKDVKFNLSFPQNIQKIFFRIFRDYFKDIEKYLNKGNKFNQKQFLDNLDNKEDRQFWEEIINTQAFENFILEFSYIDCEDNQRFKNILLINEDNEEEWEFCNSYSITFNIPNSIGYLTEQIVSKLEDTLLKTKGIINCSQTNLNNTINNYDALLNSSNNSSNILLDCLEQEEMLDYISILESDYNLILYNIINYNICFSSDEHNSRGSLNNTNYLNSPFINRHIKSNSKSTFLNSNSKNNNSKLTSNNYVNDISNISPYNITANKIDRFTVNNSNNNYYPNSDSKKYINSKLSISKFGINNIDSNKSLNYSGLINTDNLQKNNRCNSENIIDYLSKRKIPDRSSELINISISFEFYGKSGLLKFYKDLYNNLTKSEINNISIKSFLKPILIKLYEENKKIKRIKFLNNKSTSERSANRDMNISYNNILCCLQANANNNSIINYNNNNNNKNNKNSKNVSVTNNSHTKYFSLDNLNIDKLEDTPIVELEKKKCFQYYSCLAFIFQLYNDIEYKEFIFNCYLEACFMDKHNFHSIMFYEYIKTISYNDLCLLKEIINLEKLLDIVKLRVKFIKSEDKKKLKLKQSNKLNKQKNILTENIINKNYNKKLILSKDNENNSSNKHAKSKEINTHNLIINAKDFNSTKNISFSKDLEELSNTVNKRIDFDEKDNKFRSSKTSLVYKNDISNKELKLSSSNKNISFNQNNKNLNKNIKIDNNKILNNINNTKQNNKKSSLSSKFSFAKSLFNKFNTKNDENVIDFIDDKINKDNIKTTKVTNENKKSSKTMIKLSRTKINKHSSNNLAMFRNMSDNKSSSGTIYISNNDLKLVNSSDRNPYEVSKLFITKAIEVIQLLKLYLFKENIDKKRLKDLILNNQSMIDEFYKLANEIGVINNSLIFIIKINII